MLRVATVVALMSISMFVHAQVIDRAEYFIDADPGAGNATSLPITPASSQSNEFSIDISSLSRGFHWVGFRYRDNLGRWTLNTSRKFYILPAPVPPPTAATSIVKAEYFLNHDPGPGKGVPLPVTAGASQSNNFLMDITALAPGFHQVAVRYQDNLGRWSLFLNRKFYILPVNVIAGASLVKAEYFIDTDPGFGSAMDLAIAATTSLDQTFNLDLSTVPVGNHILYIRVKDSKGFWSYKVAANFTMEPCIPPVPPTVTDGSRCGQGTVSLMANGTVNGKYRWYTASTGGVPITGEVNATFVTPVLSTQTTYYVSIANGPCESVRVPAVANILSKPLAPIVGTPAPVCSERSVGLSASGGTDGQYRWYEGVQLIAGAVNSNYTISSLKTTTTYSATIFNGTCESDKATVTVEAFPCNPPDVSASTSTAFVDGIVKIDLKQLVTDKDNNIDPTSIQIVAQPSSGASAAISDFVLMIDYTSVPFVGTDVVRIKVCDLTSFCSEKDISIELTNDLKIYNAVSPDGDGKNDIFYIEYINLIPDTKQNRVSIYNRWGDEIWKGIDYDNSGVVFRGVNSAGNELPTGTYFYKIEFTERETITGFISLRR